VIVSTPVSAQATSIQPGLAISLDISADTMKMPEPIMEPVTTMVASNNSGRGRSLARAWWAVGRLMRGANFPKLYHGAGARTRAQVDVVNRKGLGVKLVAEPVPAIPRAGHGWGRRSHPADCKIRDPPQSPVGRRAYRRCIRGRPCSDRRSSGLLDDNAVLQLSPKSYVVPDLRRPA